MGSITCTTGTLNSTPIDGHSVFICAETRTRDYVEKTTISGAPLLCAAGAKADTNSVTCEALPKSPDINIRSFEKFHTGDYYLCICHTNNARNIYEKLMVADSDKNGLVTKSEYEKMYTGNYDVLLLVYALTVQGINGTPTILGVDGSNDGQIPGIVSSLIYSNGLFSKKP